MNLLAYSRGTFKGSASKKNMLREGNIIERRKSKKVNVIGSFESYLKYFLKYFRIGLKSTKEKIAWKRFLFLINGII